jgi:hypothetical protein
MRPVYCLCPVRGIELAEDAPYVAPDRGTVGQRSGRLGEATSRPPCLFVGTSGTQRPEQPVRDTRCNGRQPASTMSVKRTPRESGGRARCRG